MLVYPLNAVEKRCARAEDGDSIPTEAIAVYRQLGGSAEPRGLKGPGSQGAVRLKICDWLCGRQQLKGFRRG
ncbi:hypothetical protein PJL15_02484 [Paenarthrobacter nitroguajacolicus]|nr:hypothetical protein [Paenarthrobacter nitroguajacolicus]